MLSEGRGVYLGRGKGGMAQIADACVSGIAEVVHTDPVGPEAVSCALLPVLSYQPQGFATGPGKLQHNQQ